MSSVTPAQLDEWRSERDVFVLDIRLESAYRDSHIEESYNAPVYHQLRQGKSDALDEFLEDIPADGTVVSVCKAGVVARKATETLSERGYDAQTLVGGYTGWRQYEEKTLVYRLASLIDRLLP